MGQIDKKEANIKSLKESWLDTTTPQVNLMFTFMAGIRQFERDLISQRTKESLEAERDRERKGGRKLKLDDNKKEAIYELYQQRKTYVICLVFQNQLYTR